MAGEITCPVCKLTVYGFGRPNADSDWHYHMKTHHPKQYSIYWNKGGKNYVLPKGFK